MHVLGTPPAFILSQDQTLRNNVCTFSRMLVPWFLLSKSTSSRLPVTLQLLRYMARLPSSGDKKPMLSAFSSVSTGLLRLMTYRHTYCAILFSSVVLAQLSCVHYTLFCSRDFIVSHASCFVKGFLKFLRNSISSKKISFCPLLSDNFFFWTTRQDFTFAALLCQGLF